MFLTFKITRSKLSFLGSSKKEINIRDFTVFTRVGQGSNLGPTLRYLLKWVKVRAKGLPGGIYWLGQGGNQVPTLQYLLVVVIYSRGPRFEPKKEKRPCEIDSSGPKFEPKA
jgi:hypothetical protein